MRVMLDIVPQRFAVGKDHKHFALFAAYSVGEFD